MLVPLELLLAAGPPVDSRHVGIAAFWSALGPLIFWICLLAGIGLTLGTSGEVGKARAAIGLYIAIAVILFFTYIPRLVVGIL